MRSSLLRAALASVLACAALVAPMTPVRSAHADEAEDAKAARDLFERGVALMNARRDVEACPVLQASLDRFPGNGTRGKLAECYEKVGRIASAWATYREVARVAGEALDLKRKEVAEARAEALAPRLAHLTIVPPASAPAGLVVTVDGVETPQTAFGQPAPHDGGLVTLEARAPGYQSFRGTVRVPEGQMTRFEVPALEPATAAPARVPDARTVAPATSRDASVDHGPARASHGPGRWRMPVAIGLGGAGVLSLGIGTVLAFSAKGTYDGAFDAGRCDRATGSCDEAGQRDTESARSRATGATALFVVGAALAAGGAVVYFTTPRARRLFGFTPIVHPQGGAAVMTLSL